jgi:signal transduction histidine kinase
VTASGEFVTEGCTPERRGVIRVVGTINLLFLAVDVILYGPAPWVVTGRLLVSAALAAAELALARGGRPARIRIALSIAAVAIVAGFALIAAGTGGAASPYLVFLAFVPILVGIGVPDEPSVNAVSGLSALAVGVGLSAASGASPTKLGFVALGVGSCTFYGAVSAALYRRMRRRERSAWAAQAEAAAALSRSELRRATAERAGAVGRIAAELGHELSNPVASAAANLRFVEEELIQSGRGEDLLDAVRESTEALERVSRVVADLRVLTPDAGAELGDVDLRRAIELGLELASLRLGAEAAVARHLPAKLPQVQASSGSLSQVVSILVGLFSGGEGGADPISVDVALEDAAVKVTFTGRRGDGEASGRGPDRAGVAIALCRELAEPWGGRVEARPVPGDRVELALTLRRTAEATGGARAGMVH